MLNAERTESYGYDVISQLTSFKRGSTVDKTYEFDLLGNRVKTLENGVVTNYTSNNVNAYTKITGGLNFVPQYDGNGNMLNDDKHTFVYDYNNKLVSADNNASTYKYDALGRRVGKNNTLFYYVDEQMVEEVTDDITTSYLYGNNIDEALQMKRADDEYYYHANQLGSTMAITDSEKQLLEIVEYDVYGTPTFKNRNIGNKILFIGREFDDENSTYYFRERSQHPQIGRFIQHDILLYIDGMNDYTYVVNNPIIYIDSWGLERNLVIDILIGDCLDCFSKDCMSGIKRTAKCMLCAAGFTPAKGAVAGAKGVSMAGKLGKGADKIADLNKIRKQKEWQKLKEAKLNNKNRLKEGSNGQPVTNSVDDYNVNSYNNGSYKYYGENNTRTSSFGQGSNRNGYNRQTKKESSNKEDNVHDNKWVGDENNKNGMNDALLNQQAINNKVLHFRLRK